MYLKKIPGHIKVEGSDTFFDLTNLIKIIEIKRNCETGMLGTSCCS